MVELVRFCTGQRGEIGTVQSGHNSNLDHLLLMLRPGDKGSSRRSTCDDRSLKAPGESWREKEDNEVSEVFLVERRMSCPGAGFGESDGCSGFGGSLSSSDFGDCGGLFSSNFLANSPQSLTAQVILPLRESAVLLPRATIFVPIMSALLSGGSGHCLLASRKSGTGIGRKAMPSVENQELTSYLLSHGTRQ